MKSGSCNTLLFLCFALNLTLMVIIGGHMAYAHGDEILNHRLHVVAKLDQAPGNIAVTKDNRIIFSQHQFYNPEYRVVELKEDGTVVPFPNKEWASAPDENGIGMQAVLGIRADVNGIVWMLDNGSDPKKIVAWDTTKNALHRVITLDSEVAPPGSFPNDLAIDLNNGVIYIADIGGTGLPALIIVDLNSGKARRILEGTPPVMPEDDAEMVVDGKAVRLKGEDGEIKVARIGINPITIDPQSDFVYFGAMHGHTLYRVQPRYLLDQLLDEKALLERIKVFAKKPVSDGISIDNAGNIYVTDVSENAIGLIRPRGTYEIFYEQPEGTNMLSWPDAITAGPDFFMYASVNQLHRSPPLNLGEDDSRMPYYIVKFHALAPATVGR